MFMYLGFRHFCDSFTPTLSLEIEIVINTHQISGFRGLVVII